MSLTNDHWEAKIAEQSYADRLRAEGAAAEQKRLAALSTEEERQLVNTYGETEFNLGADDINDPELLPKQNEARNALLALLAAKGREQAARAVEALTDEQIERATSDALTTAEVRAALAALLRGK